MVNFLFCSTPGRDSEYKYVPCELVPPACCRIGHLVCLKRTSMTNEDILKTALQKGVQLKRAQVEKCLASCGIPYPTEGSGKSGRVLKPDLVDALLQHFFPDEAQAELSRMRQRLVKDPSYEDDDAENDAAEECPVELLRVLKSMDLENRDHFRNVMEQAANMLERRSEKEMKAAAAAAAPTENPDPNADVAPEAAAAGDGPPDPPPPPAADAPPVAADAPEDSLPAHVHAGSDAPRPRATRRLTPESLKALLPPLEDDKVYLKWKSRQSQVQVEFVGSWAVHTVALLGLLQKRRLETNPES